MNWNIRKK